MLCGMSSYHGLYGPAVGPCSWPKGVTPLCSHAAAHWGGSGTAKAGRTCLVYTAQCLSAAGCSMLLSCSQPTTTPETKSLLDDFPSTIRLRHRVQLKTRNLAYYTQCSLQCLLLEGVTVPQIIATAKLSICAIHFSGTTLCSPH